MSTARREAPGQLVAFAIWAAVGAGAALAVLGALTIGIFVAPVVAVVAWMLVRARGVDRSIAGAVSGVSLMLFFVAWVNREGPGTVCTVSAQSTTCEEQWNPWPWFALGLVLLLGGIALFRVWGRRQRSGP